MLKTSQMLTITVPKATYSQIKKEAVRRKSTVSGLLQDSFEYFIEEPNNLYSDQEIKRILVRDRIPFSLQKEVDTLLKRQP